MSVEHDPDVLAMRAELVTLAFEACFTQVRGVCRFLELGENAAAIKAMERAMPFWASALEEMRAIRTAVRPDQLTADAAADYRAQREGESSRRRDARPSEGVKQNHVDMIKEPA